MEKALEKKEPTQIMKLQNILKAGSVQQQFENALKENAPSFIASVIDLYGGDTYLQNCDPKLVVMECLKAAVLKLPINKSLGFAYIVPYKKNGVQLPQFQMGYKGYIQMAMRTGQYRFINADIVYEGELKEVNKLTGEIDFGGTKTSDKIVGYFAYIELLNGFSKTLYMTLDKVKLHGKKYSKSFEKSFSAWSTDFDAMALKTVLRNLLSHYGFLSVEMISVFDSEYDGSPEQEINDNANSDIIDISEDQTADDKKKGRPAGSKNKLKAEEEKKKTPEKKEEKKDPKPPIVESGGQSKADF